MLRLRLLAAALGIPVIIYLTYIGGYFYFTLVLLLTLVSLGEFLSMVGGRDFVLPKIVPLMAALGIIAVQYLVPEYFAFSLIIVLLLFAFLSVLFFPRLTPWELMTVIWGIMYIAGCLSFLLLLRALEQGFTLSLLLFIGIWANDSGAYFFGLAFGRRKMAPLVSPKKTMEGAAGGTLCTLVALGVYAVFLRLDIFMALAAALLLSLAGYSGDLVISALKRHFHIKDTGIIIPGHGGFLDRFDSLIFAAPLLYIMLILFF